MNQTLIKDGVKISKFFITEKLIEFLTRFLDVWLIAWAFTDPTVGGAFMAYAVITPVNFLLSAIIVWVLDLLESKGYDVTSLGEVRDMAEGQYGWKQPIRKILGWIMKKPKLIFWIGSWFYLDPDYVTILLRDPKVSVWKNIYKILLPSILFQMLVWVPIFWIGVNLALEGYEWAKFFIE